MSKIRTARRSAERAAAHRRAKLAAERTATDAVGATHRAKLAAERTAAHREALTAVREYERADGTAVRAYVKNGIPAIHDVYGRGIIHPEDYNSDSKLVRFVVRGSGKRFTVGRTALETV